MANLKKRRERHSTTFTLQLKEPTLVEALRQSDSKQAALLVIAGMDMGRMILLNQPVTVLGRSVECHGVIHDDGISRKHAEVRRQDDGSFLLIDLGSTNGIYISDRKVEQSTLREGDKILLGRGTVLQFLAMDTIDAQFCSKMYESMVRDGLTGVFNRKYFDERLAAELSFARRHNLPASLLIFDLDHFKKINDTWGHQIGDLVLQAVAQTVQGRIRGEDMLARYGGEEFAIIACGLGLQDGMSLAEDLRREVEAMRILTPDGEHIPVTISIGIACAEVAQEVVSTDLIALADRNMYQAKQKGRNRIESSAGS